MAYQEHHWLHRLLQFLLGAFIGAAVGFGAWREFPDLPGWLFLAGGALILGTIAAIVGDRLWHSLADHIKW